MTPPSTFSVTYDYRCPFARNAHEHVVEALDAGAGWDVRFVPFSLDQMHVPEDEPPVWDRPGEFPGLLVNLAGTVVRDRFPDDFRRVHLALFAARHDEGRDLRDPAVVRSVLDSNGVDSAAVLDAVDSGEAVAVVRAEHEAAERDQKVWGVPTFVAGGQAVFVRLMSRPRGDAGVARSTVERVLELHSWPDLNEYKHTSIPR